MREATEVGESTADETEDREDTVDMEEKVDAVEALSSSSLKPNTSSGTGEAFGSPTSDAQNTAKALRGSPANTCNPPEANRLLAVGRLVS